MKIIYVANPHDNMVSGPKQPLIEAIARRYPDAEWHVLDFNAARSILPISHAPSVFIEFDEVAGDFDPSNLDEIVTAVKEKGLAKGR